MDKRTIQCESCGGDYETSRANTKYCGLCRIMKDLQFMSIQGARRCWLCDTAFAPLHKHDTACGKCTYEKQSNGTAPCTICAQDKVRAFKDVNICNVCAREPMKRQAFGRKLQAKIAKQRAHNAVAS